MDNQKKPSKYGTLYHKPEHYERLWMLESSRKPEYLNNTFEADNERAGGMQLRRIAFDELQNKGYFKDRKYEEITPNEAMAGAMKYSSIIADNYGLTNEYWNALAFKEGPTAIKALYDKHGGNLKKAMGDPALRTEGREYLTKYLKTKLSDQINEKPAYVKDMYKVILEGGDINSVDPKKYYVSPTVKKAQAGLETKKEDNGFELNKMLTMPGMTKYTAGLSPVASAMANSIGLNGQTKGDLLGGAGMGALSGFLSGGPLGAILGGAGSLLTYGSNMAAKQLAEKEGREAEIKSKTIPGREGMEMPLMYGKQGGEVVPRLLNNFIKKYSGGGFSTEGYRSDSPDVDNAMNIIPGGNISMKDVNFPVTAYPMSNGQIQGPYTMTPDKEYNFSSADAVIEIPEAQMGKEIGGVKEGIHVFAHTPKSYYYNLDNLNPDQATEWLKKTDDYYNQKEAIAWINEDIKDENSAILAGKGKVGELAWQLNKEGNKAFPSVQNQIKTIRKSNIHPLKSDPPEIMELYDKKYYTDNTFKIEAERGKKILEKQYGPVTIHTASENDFENKYKSIPEGSNVMFLDHSGDQMFGLGLNKFQNTLASKQPKICIGGSCYSAEQFTKLKELLPNSKVLLSEGKWKGFNANNKGDEAIIPKSTDEMKLRFPENRPLAEPNLITENYQMGSPVTRDTIFPNASNKALFDMYSKGDNRPKYIINENQEGTPDELSTLEKGLKYADDIMSAPSRGMVKLITGKYQDPSEAWGYENPQGFLQNAANVAIDMIADPMNLVPVGAALKGLGKAQKVLETIKPVVKGTDKYGNIIIDEVKIKKYRDLLPSEKTFKYKDDPRRYVNNLDFENIKKLQKNPGISKIDELKLPVDRYFYDDFIVNKTNNIGHAINTVPLVNDVIDIKKGKAGYNKNTPVYEDQGWGPLASGYKNAVPTVSKGIKKKVNKISKPSIIKQAVTNVENKVAEEKQIVIPQHSKMVNGQRIPITEKEANEIMSKGKVSTAPGQTIKEKDRKNVYIKPLQQGGYVQGETYELDDKEIKRLLSLGYQIQ